MTRRSIAVLVATLAVVPPVAAAGLMRPVGEGPESLEIRTHRVEVVINDGFAITTVDQVFHNPVDRDLEALYTFPLPRDASLSELSLWVDGREEIGEVVEKARAERIYRRERDSGHDSALAVKRDYLAFDVHVSRVPASDDARVRLVYLQPLEIDHGVGRYVYPLEEGGIDDEILSFWDRRPEVRERFSFRCTVRSSYPVESVKVNGWDDHAQVTTSAMNEWSVHIDGGGEDAVRLDRDVVLYYRLADDLPARVDVLPYRAGDGPGTVLIAITPGNDLREITEGIDWTVVLDVSGSMATKLPSASDAVSRAVGRLRPGDRFRIATFSRGARWLTRGWRPVDPAAVAEARELLGGVRADGGTNLYAGVGLALEDLDRDRTSAVLLVSDGGANVGPTAYAAFRQLLGRSDVRVFTFVVGQGANVPLLERMAEESGGFATGLSNRDDLYGRLLQARAALGREAMHGIEIRLDGVEIGEIAPERIPSVYHGQQIVLLGRYLHAGDATLRMTARISGEPRSWETRIALPEYDDLYPELERIWALARIRDLERRREDAGGDEGLRREIVDLATRYAIVTDETSMVIVRDDRREEHGLGRANADRVARERAARETRVRFAPRDTRADASRPMYGGASAHGLGGGAADVGWIALALGALAAGGLLRRRER